MTELTTRVAGTDPNGGRWQSGLLLVLSGNMLLDALEVASTVVALPTVGRDLGIGPGLTHYLMSAFAFGFAGALLTGGRLIEWLGRRRVYLGALVVFALASAVAGLADGPGLLIGARFVKGVCVGLTAPTGLTIIATAFCEGPARRRAISVYSLFGAAGFSLGLVLSGLLTAASWRLTFLFPAPVAVLLLLAGLALIPTDPERASSPAVEPKSAGRLLTCRPFVGAALGAAALNGPYWGFLFVLTYQLQTGWGLNPLSTGLAMLPASLPLAIAAPFSGALVARFGTARLICVAALAPPLGYAHYLWAGPPSSYPVDVLPTVLLVGVGFVVGFSALHLQATSAVSGPDQSRAGPVYQSSVQIGGALTLVLVAAVLPAAAVGGPGNESGWSAGAVRPAVLLITVLSAAGLVAALIGRGRSGP